MAFMYSDSEAEHNDYKWRARQRKMRQKRLRARRRSRLAPDDRGRGLRAHPDKDELQDQARRLERKYAVKPGKKGKNG